METDNEDLARKALDAFWNVVAAKFPETNYGDLSPLTTFGLTVAAERAIDEWTRSNVPSAHRHTRKAKTPAHTAGPWTIEDSQSKSWTDDNGTFALTEIVCSDEGNKRVNTAIAYVWDRDKEDEANAFLIAAAPELLESLESLTEMAESVTRNWENGNLAEAVKNLGRIAHEAAEVAHKARQVEQTPPATSAA